MKRKSNMKEIMRVDQEAKSRGMTYGKYVAERFLEQQKMERLRREQEELEKISKLKGDGLKGSEE